MNRAKIISVGHYVPEKILTNLDLEKMVETSDEWITQRTGIKERHIAEADEFTSDMGIKAARVAIERAKINPEEIDIIICATITGDYPTPATACIIQAQLGATNAFAFDISAACSGFLYALSIAEKYILAEKNKTVLVIAVEKLSTITNWEDRSTCVLFGDGAGAAILKSSDDERGIVSSYLKTDGNLFDYLIVPAGGSCKPLTINNIENKEQFLAMQGNDVFKHAVNKMVDSIYNVMENSNWNKDDVNMLFTHQANVRIIDAIRKKLEFEEEKVFVNLHKYGNTSAATIPIALSEAYEDKRIKKGDKIILASFGGGFTWGGVSLIW